MANGESKKEPLVFRALLTGEAALQEGFQRQMPAIALPVFSPWETSRATSVVRVREASPSGEAARNWEKIATRGANSTGSSVGDCTKPKGAPVGLMANGRLAINN